MSERDPRIEPRPGDVLRKGDREIMVHFVERGQVYFDRTCDFGFSGARITIEQFREHAQEADRVEVIGGPKNRRWFDGPDLMQWKTMVAHGDYTLPFWCFPWGGLFTTMEEFARIMHAVMTPDWQILAEAAGVREPSPKTVAIVIELCEEF